MMGDESLLPFRDEWYRQVPNLHRWVSGDRSEPFVRQYPHHLFEVDFWFAPYFLMRVVLGWRDCSEGIAKLLEGGHELEGPIATLPEAWDDRILGSLGWWAWSNAGYVTKGPPGPRFKEQGLTERFQQVAEVEGLTGGCDPKHLVPHLNPCVGPLQSDHHDSPARTGDNRDDVRIVTEHKARRCVVLVHRYDQWPVALAALGRDLPDGPPSWRVNVVTDDQGHLGEFRRCWDCGAWFQGPARFHQWGHLDDGA